MNVLTIRGDARRLPLADNSVHSVVCDPPYALGFMGKEWDNFGDTGRGARARTERAAEVTPAGRGHTTSAGPYLAAGVDSLRSAGRPFQQWCEQWATEALRVLRPGGHLLAFGGTRTFHRLTCAIEDAGFEIRDSVGCLTWCYGSGFPKSLDVSKAIDKAAGAEREVVGLRRYADGTEGHWGTSDTYAQDVHTRSLTSGTPKVETAPATAAAVRWQGWGTALKPSWEPIVVARKPLAGTVAGTVLAWGTGAINVDGCRVEGAPKPERGPRRRLKSGAQIAREGGPWAQQDDAAGLMESVAVSGRWPSNLVVVHHPECADRCVPECHAAEMDRQSGVRPAGGDVTGRQMARTGDSGIYGHYDAGTWTGYGDSGGASRFFPQFKFNPKADTAERPVIVRDGQRIQHPTVKPTALMSWLVRLVTPPGGTVLDPFAGSGATLQAALVEGFNAVGVELDADHCDLIRARLSRPIAVALPDVVDPVPAAVVDLPEAEALW